MNKINKIIYFFKIGCYNSIKSLRKKEITMESTLQGKVKSIDFAIYLTKKAKDMNVYINLTKLQKLLYICYGLYLAFAEDYLLDERPEAWQYGPLFPKVHKKQKENNNSLERLITSIDEADFKEFDFVVNIVLETFKDWTAIDLVNWTHEEGTAWHKRYIKQNKPRTFLDNFDIKLDFSKFIINEEGDYNEN